jgi:hypothetical protein
MFKNSSELLRYSGLGRYMDSLLLSVLILLLKTNMAGQWRINYRKEEWRKTT